MNAKQYLRKLQYLDEEIKRYEEQAQEIYDRLTNITSSTNAVIVQHSSSDKMAGAMERLERIRYRALEKATEYYELKQTIMIQIDNIPDGRYRQVLYLRYVKCIKDWNEIADQMSYSVDRVWHLHGEALRVFQTMYL